MKKHSVLHVGFVQPPLEKAFAESFEHYKFIEWTQYQKKAEELRRVIIEAIRDRGYDLIFFQLQTANMITSAFCKQMKEINPSCLIVNWTGDVRHPLPEWYVEVGMQVDITLFSNNTDAQTATAAGINAGYLQIGFDDEIFKLKENPLPFFDAPEIVFMGNNYLGTFPLSQLRYDMVAHLHKRYGERFGVYGGNWKELERGNLMNKESQEAACYRSCKVAINLSHYDYELYSSDRIFRIMGSGAFCLSKIYPGLEKEFTPGINVGLWNYTDNFDDLDSKIDYYLEHEEERTQIAKAGYELVHSKYTWTNRVEELRKIINLT